MLAVLPFENLTGDAGQEYFSDGLTEEMITQLGRLDPQHLGVIARTSVMHYKHSPEQLEQIGRELGVQYVLGGSVRRDSDKVRITAQLIQMKDQAHLWAQEYDRELKDLLVLQGEIAREISDETQVALGGHRQITPINQPSLSPQALEAYDLYLKGRYFWNKRTIEGFQRAIGYFQQAIAQDPNYAPAYAGLADSYTLLSGYSLAPQTECLISLFCRSKTRMMFSCSAHGNCQASVGWRDDMTYSPGSAAILTPEPSDSNGAADSCTDSRYSIPSCDSPARTSSMRAPCGVNCSRRDSSCSS
jgi:TolB-like protein